MKLLFLYGILILFGWQTCSMNNPALITEMKPEGIIKDSIIFSSQVQPIFVKHCSPCHFTGGKMYERLPFDKDTTIINHETGIMKRIKDEKEVLMIRSFIAQNKNGSSKDKPSKESVNK